jgi:hypothetical protein
MDEIYVKQYAVDAKEQVELARDMLRNLYPESVGRSFVEVALNRAIRDLDRITQS